MTSVLCRVGAGLAALACSAAVAAGQGCPPAVRVVGPDGPVTNQGASWIGSTGLNEPLTAVFTISNKGCDPLTIQSIDALGVAGQVVEILSMPAATVPPDGSTVMELYVHANQPTDFGAREIAMVTIRTNDAANDPFVFWAEGDIAFPCPPAAAFSCEGRPVGPTFDFGATRQGVPVERTFTLTNTGCDTMTGIQASASGGPDTDGYRIVQAPASSLEAGQSTTFTVRMTAEDVGACDGDVYVQINARWNAGVYDDWFLLTGSVRCPADMDLDGALTLNDFVTFRNLYTAGDLAADFDGSGGLTLNDYVTFRNAFVGACP